MPSQITWTKVSGSSQKSKDKLRDLDATVFCQLRAHSRLVIQLFGVEWLEKKHSPYEKKTWREDSLDLSH